MKTEWVHKKLGDCCERICNGLTYDVEETQGYFVTRIETISDGYIDYNKIGHINDKPNQDYLMVNGDILFSHINSVKHIGKVAYYDDSTELYHGMNLLLLRANNNIDKLFLFYLLSSDKYRRKIRTLAKSAVNQASISTTDLGKFEISYPADLSAQRRIAAILASADKVIAATQKTIAKYKQIRQGMMEDLLKPKEGWKMVKLGECCTIHGRIGFRGYTTDDLVEKGYGAITFSPSDIHNFKLCYDDCDYITWKKYEESPEIKVFNGDILFCKTASIGKCAYVEGLKEKATINPQFVVLKNFQCDSKFLFYKLISYGFQTQVQGITGGSTIKTMSQEKLSLEEITIPDLAAQRRIAAILSGIDAKIAAEEKVLQKYEKVKKGLMERLLNDNK